MPGLNESPKYRKFITDRDKALEKILTNSHRRINDFTTLALREIEGEVSVLCIRHGATEFPQTKVLVEQLDARLKNVFYYLGVLISRELTNLMRRANVLAQVGEAEAIARTVGNATYNVNPGTSKVPNQNRIQYLLNSTRYKILKAFEQGLVIDESSNDVFNRVIKAFPPCERYSKPPRVLKKIKEAERSKRIDAANGFVTDEQWQDVVHDYLNEYVPQYSVRSPDRVMDIKQPSGEYEERYGWEIEKETNHAFIDQVRSGQNETANQNGYTDMVWISILDDKTDDCCEWRNGLTSSEIEAKLEGEHADDECDAIVPPAHFNCRCSLAPYTEDIGEPEKVDFSDFDEWLKN